jgi:transcriptional regulator with XRE-family HTH domain
MVTGPTAVHPEEVNREELAAFLRKRRAAVRPADVGLEAGPRRRTPGLRRQEVAQLAGMSVEYYIRLEQARGPRPSRQMLGAIARALRLSDDERDHLYRLAGQEPGPPPGPVREVRAGLLRMIDRLDDTPALVCDAVQNVLAWNAMAAALLGDLLARPPEDRNVAVHFFIEPGARERYAPDDAGVVARNLVADLRVASARYPRDPGVRALIGRLLEAGAGFRELWDEQDVTVPHSNRKRVRHPQVGWLDLGCDALHDPQRDQWVVFFTAAPGTPSHEALQLLKVIGTQRLTS